MSLDNRSHWLGRTFRIPVSSTTGQPQSRGIFASLWQVNLRARNLEPEFLKAGKIGHTRRCLWTLLAVGDAGFRHLGGRRFQRMCTLLSGPTPAIGAVRKARDDTSPPFATMRCRRQKQSQKHPNLETSPGGVESDDISCPVSVHRRSPPPAARRDRALGCVLASTDSYASALVRAGGRRSHRGGRDPAGGRPTHT